VAAPYPVGLDVEYLRDEVIAAYDRVAREPHGEFHLNRGIDYACAYLAYDRHELGELPQEATSRFVGVGNPLRIGPIYSGEIVLDHACGSGTDLLLAAQRVGPAGYAIGVDVTPAMRASARLAAEIADMTDRVEIRAGVYEDLPVDSASIDVVISNGVLSLAPDKCRVLSEVFRVLKPGGRFYLADTVLPETLTPRARTDPNLWAACIAGALSEEQLQALVAAAGFEGTSFVERFNSFANTIAERKLARDLFVRGVNFVARKPAG